MAAKNRTRRDGRWKVRMSVSFTKWGKGSIDLLFIEAHNNNSNRIDHAKIWWHEFIPLRNAVRLLKHQQADTMTIHLHRHQPHVTWQHLRRGEDDWCGPFLHICNSNDIILYVQAYDYAYAFTCASRQYLMNCDACLEVKRVDDHCRTVLCCAVLCIGHSSCAQ